MIGPLSAPGEGARLCFSIMGLTGWDWVCWQAHSFPLPFVPPCVRRAALRYILGRLARAHGPRPAPRPCCLCASSAATRTRRFSAGCSRPSSIGHPGR